MQAATPAAACISILSTLFSRLCRRLIAYLAFFSSFSLVFAIMPYANYLIAVLLIILALAAVAFPVIKSTFLTIVWVCRVQYDFSHYMLNLCFSSSQSKEVQAMQRLHFSIGSSSYSPENPRQAPLCSCCGCPYRFIKLQCCFFRSILHFLHTIFLPVVQPFCLA